MKTMMNHKVLLGVTVLLGLVLAVGGLQLGAALAQGPFQGGNQGGNPAWNMHDNQAVLDLLKSTQNDLYQLRQGGKTWAEIATSKSVSETALIDALLAPMKERHAAMAQQYPQFNAEQMTQYMTGQFQKDLGTVQFGTLTDRHVFGGGGMMGNWDDDDSFPGGMMRGGMMGNWSQNGNFPGGMMRGGGMMGNWDNDDIFPGGMMGGGGMHGWNNYPGSDTQ